MSEENDKTLISYARHLQKYIDGTPQQVSGGVKNWIDAAVCELPVSSKILELGSAFGRDAAYLLSKGYKIECTDATEKFVSYLIDRGFDARSYNMITDTLPDFYDLIFANAVLLHLKRNELPLVVSKMHSSLKNGGRFAFSLKKGQGEVWSNEKLNAPRFFCYWGCTEIEDILAATGFDHWTIDEDSSGHGSAEWLHIIAHKKPF